MKNFSKEPKPTVNLDNLPSGNKTRQGKLYVAYRNNTMIDAFTTASDYNNGYESKAKNNRASVFSTSGGSYYIDGIPAILSQDDEAMLYDGELSEYY